MRRSTALLLLLAAPALAGCYGERMDAALAPLDGRPVGAAFTAFGPANSEETDDGNRVYSWKVSEFGPMGLPSNLGVQYECRVSVTADSQGIVRYTTWRGNAYGCNALLARWH
jgi:hypothetical protein